MKRPVFLFLWAAALIAPAMAVPNDTPLSAAATDPVGGSDVVFVPPVGGSIPNDAAWLDENGRPTSIAALLHGKPALLIPVYFECPMLCTYTLSGLLSALRAIHPTTGRDFQIIVFSIDPEEGPALARAKRETYLKAYRRPEGEDGWHFLTGSPASIRRLTDAIGFRYAADPAHDAFAHAAGIVVLSPDGRISRLLPGVEFEPRQIRLALAEARSGRFGRWAARSLLRCYKYDPHRAPYTRLILALMRTTASLGALTLFAGVGALLYEERRRRPAGGRP